MKFNRINYIIIVLLMSFYSCKNKTIKTYYETGELKTKVIKTKSIDSISLYKEYYKNGVLKQEGQIKNDSVMEGHHVIYFADGTLLWEGIIKNNVVQDKNKWHWNNSNSRFQGIDIEGDPDSLIPNRDYNFRVILPDVYPMYYDVVDLNYNSLENPEINYTYPYKFTFKPDKFGKYVMRITFMSKGGYFVVGSPFIEITISSASKSNN